MFKEICNKIALVLEYIIGIALAVCLFAGGLGFIGYAIALCLGGQTAAEICDWIFNTYYAVLIKIGTITTLLTFLKMYFKGEANWVNPIKRLKKTPRHKA